jgi:uncharacterized coiled-coil protein SlyX
VSETPLPADPAELRALVVELYAVIQAKDAQVRRLEAQVATLTARVEELERGQRKDSSTSSKPPSSDSIFTKQPRRSDRSLRERGSGERASSPARQGRRCGWWMPRRCAFPACRGCARAAVRT